MVKYTIVLFFNFWIINSFSLKAVNDSIVNGIEEKVDLAIAIEGSDPDSAMRLGYEILRESEKINYDKGIGYAYVRIGVLHYKKGNNDSAITFLREAIRIRQNINEVAGVISLLRYIGYIQKVTGKIDSAFASFYLSVTLAEKSKDTVLLINSYLELAHMLSEYDELENAKFYYDKALDLAEVKSDKKTLAICYEGYGKYYNHIGDFDKALDYYLKAADVHSELTNKTNLSTTYNNIAVCYDNLELYELAITFYKNALSIHLELGFKKNIATTHYNLGLTYAKLNLADSSIYHLGKANKIGQQIGDLDRQSKSYFRLSHAYAMKGDFAKAYESHRQYSSFKDSLLNIEKVNSIAEMQTKYETEKKEQQIVLLDEQNKTKEAQRNLLLAAAGALFLFLMVLGIFFIQRGRIAKKNEEIAQQKIESLLDEQEIKTYNAMLEGQEEERMRIATDLHDRLGSMLSTVKLLFSALDEKIDKNQEENKKQYEKANNLLDEACVEVRRVSHNLGTGMVANFGLVRAIEELCESIDESGKMKCQLLTYGIEEAKLKLKVEVGIYRIVQELFNNVIKHSKAKKLTVQLNALEEELSITVEDDGVGFDPVKVRQKGGMGLNNLEQRAQNLGGTLHIDSRKGKGTTTIIELPINLEA